MLRNFSFVRPHSIGETYILMILPERAVGHSANDDVFQLRRKMLEELSN